VSGFIVTKAGSFLGWIGGGITKVAASGVVAGILIVATGLTPGEAAAYLLRNPPGWLTNPWIGPGLVIIGLVIICASLFFNIWSLKQKAVDSLAEDISVAIHNLVNRDPPPKTQAQVDQWDADYNKWCDRVSEKLKNRAFFTRADQLHFERLGYLPSISMASSANPIMDQRHSKLSVKLERLREIIYWVQQRRR
jgi:hypothetical protein